MERRVALCFMVQRDVPYLSAWAAWLGRLGIDRVRVFVHASEGPPPAPVAADTFPRVFVPSIFTARSDFSLVRAQQRLFEAACAHADVAMCVLLSADAVPVVPARVMLEALLPGDAEPRSWLRVTQPNDGHRRREAMALENRDRLLPRFAWPDEWRQHWQWRVASQWVALTRAHVAQLSAHWRLIESAFRNTDTPDEHAYAVFFTCTGAYPGEFVEKSPIFVAWLDGEDVDALEMWRCEDGEEHRSAADSPKTLHLAPFVHGHSMQIKEAADAARAEGVLFMRKICPRVPEPNEFW